LVKEKVLMSAIRFVAKVTTVGSWTVVRMPKPASAKLPSRGMAMVEGTVNGFRIKIALEPDGRGSHWFGADASMLKATKAKVGDTVEVEIAPSKDCPEPKVPADLLRALGDDAQVYQQWMSITPLARWDWIRWIRATSQPETRRRRIEVACSKLKDGDRRPCCFNRNQCTEPEVSRNGVLLEPIES
jgi:hypothetical protein